MGISFTSSDEFKKDTKELAKHLKPLKLNQLRHAVAAFAGYSSVEAFIVHLDNKNAPPKRVPDNTDPNIHIHLDGNVVCFQSNPCTTIPLSTETKFAWESEVKNALIGSDEQGRVVEGWTNGVHYPRLRVVRVCDTNHMEVLSKSILYFIDANRAVTWPGYACMDTLRRHIMGWVKKTCLHEEETPITEMLDLVELTNRRLDSEDLEGASVDMTYGQFKLPVLDDDLIYEAVGHFNTQEYQQDLEALDRDNRMVSMRSLAQRILSRRAAVMFQTMMNRLCAADRTDIRNRADLAQTFQSLTSQISDDLAVAFFLDEVREFDL